MVERLEAEMDTKLSVLVVEDSSTMCRIIVELLQKLEFTDIDLAQDGRCALERMDTFGKISKTPVILIATSSWGASWLAGANAYLTKLLASMICKLQSNRAGRRARSLAQISIERRRLQNQQRGPAARSTSFSGRVEPVIPLGSLCANAHPGLWSRYFQPIGQPPRMT